MLALGQVTHRVFRLSNVSVSPLLPCAYLSLNAMIITKTRRRKLLNLGKGNRLFDIGKYWAEKKFHIIPFQASRKQIFFFGPVANTELVYKFHVALHAFYAAIPNTDFKISAQIQPSHIYQNSTPMKPIE